MTEILFNIYVSLFTEINSTLVPSGPVLETIPPDEVVFTNSTGAVLDCTARGDPPLRLSWLYLDYSPVTPIPAVREVGYSINFILD